MTFKLNRLNTSPHPCNRAMALPPNRFGHNPSIKCLCRKLNGDGSPTMRSNSNFDETSSLRVSGSTNLPSQGEAIVAGIDRDGIERQLQEILQPPPDTDYLAVSDLSLSPPRVPSPLPALSNNHLPHHSLHKTGIPSHPE
jgi:hypothetical protein